MLTGEDPLDPAIYNANRNWRRTSFTVGYEFAEGTQNDPSEREPVFGIKVLAYDRRDVSRRENQDQIKIIENELGAAGKSFSIIRRELVSYLLVTLSKQTAGGSNRLPATVKSINDLRNEIEDPDNTGRFEAILAALTDKEKKDMDEIISRYISAFVKLKATTRDVVRKIQKRPQVSLAFLTKQRKRTRPDEYTGEIIADVGMGRANFTFNGNFMFENAKIGKDQRGGMFATEMQIPLNYKPLSYKTPLLFSIGGSGKGLTGEKPTFVGQAKLTIPLSVLLGGDERFAGMEFPISVSVANRTDLIKETTVRGRFGFTFDLARFLKVLRDKYVSTDIGTTATAGP